MLAISFLMIYRIKKRMAKFQYPGVRKTFTKNYSGYQTA